MTPDGPGRATIDETNAAQLTVITKRDIPDLMSKRICLDADGKVVSDGSACLMRTGRATRVFAETADDLAKIISQCNSDQAIALGALKADLAENVRITTARRLHKNRGAIARTRDFINYQPKVPAWCLIDFDTKQMSAEARKRIDAAGGMWQALLSIAPELADAARVSRASTSAGLFRTDTGEEIAGSNGMHHYVLVSDGGDIERFLKDLHERCWLNGLGWYLIGKAGSLLERSIVDRMVFGGERLCFEGAPTVIEPLAQDASKRTPQAFEGSAIDTSHLAPLTAAEMSALLTIKAREKQARANDVAKVRGGYIDSHAEQLAKRTGITKQAAAHIIARQCDGVLLPDVELPFDDPELAGSTVGDILTERKRFEGETLADPVEGVDYGRNCAKVMVGSDGLPFIHSFAHGRTIYRLRYDVTSICKLLEQTEDADVLDRFIQLDAQAEIDDIGLENIARYLKTRTGNSIRAILRSIKDARGRRAQQRAQEQQAKGPVVLPNGIPMPQWRETRDDGSPTGSMHNAELAITALGIECRYDTFHNKMLFGYSNDSSRHALEHLGGEVSDNGVIALRHLMSDSFGFDMTEKHTRDAIISLALQHCYDPVCDMLAEAEMKWDKVARLDRMAAEHMNCEDTKLNAAFMRKTMIGAVARARHPGIKFDTITVLEAQEGYNKSTAWRVLAGDDNFSDESIIGKDSREVQEHLADVWIHENAELAGMRKAEVEQVKSFASRQEDKARPAYGHFLKTQPRHSIDVGTTNSDRYLLSQTGNRRFWPMKLLASIDIEKLKRDRLLLWGEAAYYQSQGESLVLDDALWGDAAIEQEARRVTDPWEETLAAIPKTITIFVREADHFGNIILKEDDVRIIHEHDVDGFKAQEVAAPNLLEHVLKIAPGNQQVVHSMRLSTVMKQLGWKRTSNGYLTIGGKRVRGYFRIV
jgi:predicted P-loop ATPase